MKKSRRAIATGLVILLACTGCALLGRSIANRQYGGMSTPIDREAAITVTSFPPSADIRAVIGGRGEGLDCSIPRFLQQVMFPSMADADSPVALQFRQGCVFHDNCYRHGYATYGYSQEDCDFLLVRHSFRTCVQIYDLGTVVFKHTFAGRNTVDICQARAREVLLGVRIGGVGSFKAHEQSSYYEFDPMPIYANDYVVGRLTRLPRDENLVVGDRRLISTPRVFVFDRSRLTSRRLTWKTGTKLLGEGDERFSTIFPDTAQPTPPQIVRVAGTDWYIWLTRGRPHTTGFNALVGVPAHPQANSIFKPLPCFPSGECDLDSSIVRVVPSPDGVSNMARFFAFTHRFVDRSQLKVQRGIERDTIGLHHWEVPDSVLQNPTSRKIIFPIAPIAAKLNAMSSQRYRFLQSEVHVGEFRKHGCPDVVALGRGIHLNSAGTDAARADDVKSSVADGWEDLVAAAFIPLGTGDCPASSAWTLTLPQSSEPAVPVNRGHGTRDRLLTITAAGRDAAPIRLMEYAFGETGVTQHNVRVDTIARDEARKNMPLDRSWVKSAVYVIKPPAGSTRGDRLFFSRVWLDQRNAKLFADSNAAPEKVWIQFRYFEPSVVGWTERGYSSCRIDLHWQHRIEPNRSLMRSLMWRFVKEVMQDPKKPGQIDLEMFSRLHRREMVRRWMESQVIPGYIFDDALSRADRPIDATVLFHGAADYSLLLEGVRDGVDMPDRLELRRPANDFAFAQCT